ncbi:hypothetical protein KOR42_23560 [Thalassoglobus neptunius]|uniref:Methyltransferase small domain protein n=1 Tax=Thalassoglobus neptunius TaxID=1938619 RepID=A0A5C5X8C6_9PLAN|nr:class I SAM-dependent methyltransferase [Thalassoglobus neptunius]TWT58969.1 hypothetical protein KOR42_23560 [Thalassoglobus neptunius]
MTALVANGQSALAKILADVKRVRSGQITADEVRETMRRSIDEHEQIALELNKKTLKELAPDGAGRSTKKEIVDSIIDSLQMQLLPGDSFSWEPFSETKEQALLLHAKKLTDEDIQNHVKVIQDRVDQNLKVIENPETLEEFRKRSRLLDDSSLSDEQLALWDRLESESRRELRESKKRSTTVEQFSVDGLELSLKEGYHDKNQCPLWIVQMGCRIPTEHYRELLVKAKQLGGWYSSFKKSDAGFQFYEKSQADQFLSLLHGDTDRSEILANRQRRKELTAVERLRELAEGIESRANHELNRERKENTHKRAGESAYARERARCDLAQAKTVRAIADAVESDPEHPLRDIRYLTDVDGLKSVLWAATRKRQEKQVKELAEGLSNYERNLSANSIRESRTEPSDVRFAELPHPEVYARHLYDMGNHLLKVKGAIRLGQKIKKRVERFQRKGDYNETVHFRSTFEIEELSAAYSKAVKTGFECVWIQDDITDWKRFQRLGIHSIYEMRHALRALLPLLGVIEEEPPVQKMMRDLIGVKIDGFFPTPDDICELVIQEAGIRDGMKVLEPSAGIGSLADAAREAADCEVVCVEISSRLREILKAKGHTLDDRRDFLEPKLDKDLYDRIVANPPFENGADIVHVQHAYEELAEGGRLVSIMSEGPFFRSDSKAEGFRDWLENEVNGWSRQLPSDAFSRGNAFRSTGVQTRLVVIDK